jgi:hypothetical protein
MTPARINDLQPIALLFSHISRPQLIGVEEFNDVTFKEHEKICLFCPKLDYDKPVAEPANGFPTPS